MIALAAMLGAGFAGIERHTHAAHRIARRVRRGAAGSADDGFVELLPRVYGCRVIVHGGLLHWMRRSASSCESHTAQALPAFASQVVAKSTHTAWPSGSPSGMSAHRVGACSSRDCRA